MANRREEREQLRQARLEQESSQGKSDKRRLVVIYAVVSTLVLVAVAAIVLMVSSGGGDGDGQSHINFDTTIGNTNGVQPDDRAGTAVAAAKITNLKAAAKKAGCVLRLELPDEGHTHIPPGSKTPKYKTNPPTSGNHVEPPYQQADGAYAEMPEEIDIVHSLEHGRLEIQYSPELPEKGQLELKGLYDTMYGGALLFPNENMDYEVAATTWTNLLGCPTYKGAATLDAIRAFGKETWGKYGGEPVEAFPFTGPTPANPAS